ncbi:hypothetical protein [Silvibacterium dinghuense]|uniref:Adenylate cyclase n=1 Tax=Silvibacterium dinghuense TaxID=1560006 RepID=A0A4Q1SJJ7_9BACT|nr:hypothetical protein [Silvibacterium dinghuense]RXS97609.1 hypothetical protein ESZ00_06930 [Silvibacterium dinghuense]GGH00472.1 hypothetical protein GCM10011586_15060 [Silvibacterium dinghuense]
MSAVTSSRETVLPSSAEDRAVITAELEAILASAPFRNSRRYPAMLRYIVEKTLSNEQGTLKERLIGVEVFGRDPGYDTNADPVVRFSAGEVRKRIAQFYKESERDCSIEMELPLGSYIPRFYRRVTPASAAMEAAPEISPQPQALSFLASMPAEQLGHISERGRKVLWPYYALAALCLVVIAGAFLYRARAAADPILDVWAPMLDHSEPILISAGRPHPSDEEVPEKSNITIQDHILSPEFRVTIPTLSAITNIVAFLQSQREPFRIHEAYSNTLADLHHRPVILVTGNDNKWTQVLLQPLRFHFVQQGNFSYIEDAKRPDFRGWNVDFTRLFHQQTADYAIVARFTSATTGGPVMVVAGISSNGTEAAGEFIVSPQELAQLEASGAQADLKKNFEAVLKVEMVDGNTGSATVVASQFW